MSRLLSPFRHQRGDEGDWAADAHQAKSRLAVRSRVKAYEEEEGNDRGGMASVREEAREVEPRSEPRGEGPVGNNFECWV